MKVPLRCQCNCKRRITRPCQFTAAKRRSRNEPLDGVSSVARPRGACAAGPRDRPVNGRCDLLLERDERLPLRDVDDAPTDVDGAVLGLGDGAVHRLHHHGDHHGDERQPEQQVDAGRHEVLGVLRHDVAEADRAERDEGEVERVEVRPVLPARVDERAEQRVEEGDRQRDDRRQVELVVDLVRHERLVEVAQAAQLGVDGRHDDRRLGRRRRDPAVVRRRRRAAGAAHRAHGPPTTAGEQAPADAVDEPLAERQADATERHHPASEAARVVEAVDERPDELDGARQRLADAGQHDHAERDADQRVDHRDDAAGRRHRVYVAVAYNVRQLYNSARVYRNTASD